MNELPESTIYHILSNLPEDGTVTRELARFSLVSKEWRRACSFYHVVDFIGTCSYDTPQDVQKTEKFIKFIDKTMTNCQYIRKLRLHIDFNVFSDLIPLTTLPDDSPTKALPPLFDKWIHIALDKRVQEIDLRIRVRCISRKVQENTGIEEYDAIYKDIESSNWRYHIPIRVLSSDFVKSLSLGWQVCLPRSLVDDMNMEIELPVTSLKSLQLFRLTKINTKAVVRLIGACPFLEELIIDSEYIDGIKVSGLHRLKMLSIRRCLRSNAGSSRINTSFQINIEAPSLETLCLLDLGRVGYEERVVYRTIFHLDCYNLKCLKLIRDWSMDDTKLAAFVSQFPILESLELDHCRLIKEINISNPMMKKMEFKFGNLWSGFRHVEISSPNVLHLRYESTSGKRCPSIGVLENNWPRYVEVVFRNTHQPISLFSYWFRNLRESLMRFRFSRISLSFHYMWKKESGEEKDLVPTRLPACKIDKLKLSVTGPCASFPVILSRLFSTFHATTLQASLIEDNSGQGHAFLRFLCENLLHRGNDHLCSTCFVDYKCWKHQLKEVKLEGIKGLDGKRSLNWVEMFKLLPTLTVDHQICFSLQWAT